ncbi:hypothetical protein SCHPADRAFT_150394 [Schizopora paradoxa]|uniref:Uncharacterized protein n=1 Tax=Schizopora paradoxa TaxID=27342 RepID=A0A0H2S7Y0_9AGAM|nr:hypothetical protein SCHPADRAFT_150394 [Schizopora paradoxa]
MTLSFTSMKGCTFTDISHAEKLPRSTFALKNALTIDLTAWDQFLEGPTEHICGALKHFTGSTDLSIHIGSAAAVEKGLRDFISPWHEELQNLIDEPIVIFCHIFRERRMLPKAAYRALRCERAVEAAEIRPHLWRLLGCLNSAEDSIRSRALQVVQALLGLDHYCATHFLNAFAEANRGSVVFSSGLVPYARQLRSREFGTGVAPDDAGFLRHTSVDGTFHVGRPDAEKCIEDCPFKSCSHLRVDGDPFSMCTRCGMGMEDKISLNEHVLLWLRHEHGTSLLNASSHNPILVGTDQSGVRYFLAFVDEGEGFWTTVGESDVTIRYRTTYGEWNTTENYYVLVLRFDLFELDELFPDIPEDGRDATGPFCWKRYNAIYEIVEGEDVVWSRSDLAVMESYGRTVPLRYRRAKNI